METGCVAVPDLSLLEETCSTESGGKVPVPPDHTSDLAAGLACDYEPRLALAAHAQLQFPVENHAQDQELSEPRLDFPGSSGTGNVESDDKADLSPAKVSGSGQSHLLPNGLSPLDADDVDNVIVGPVNDLFQMEEEEGGTTLSLSLPSSSSSACRPKRSATELKFRRHNETVEDEMVPELG